MVMMMMVMVMVMMARGLPTSRQLCAIPMPSAEVQRFPDVGQPPGTGTQGSTQDPFKAKLLALVENVASSL